MSDINLKLVIAMARTYNDMFFEIEKNVQEFGLNISEFGVLEMLYHKGDQPVQKVAEKILVTSGTITYVINKLEKKELVVRRKCEKDKRIFYVSLTEKGREFISDIFPKHKEFLDNLFIELNEDTKRELVDNLIQLRKILKE
ncbi:MarR family transcriptional regulator [Clostridium tertium]|uniref:MarR family transcriptional regulator n=1 Tax=Clostridium tertium TaxID=1559 RepID=A0A9X4B0C5_9CLOT|nr:MarR family transcriptional regulator [Clostridium tertium]MDC4239572.1 MarR family transcriptional regulator [Clostridium tertium]